MAKSEHVAIERTRTLKIVLPLFVLLGVGLVMVYDASVTEAQRLFQDRYYFAFRHALWVVLGTLGLLVASRIPTSWIKKVSHVLFLATFGLLLLVLIPGVGSVSQGAQRWIRLSDSISFQPSELAKLTTVLYLASWLRKKPHLAHFFTLTLALGGLLILQPDLGTAMIITTTAFLMLFISGAPIKIMVGGGVVGLLAVLGVIFSSDYRRERLMTYLDPTADTRGSSYHINQVLISLGSGGWLGLGLGRSRQKFQYLPEATTDSIFAVIGEELGLLGALGLMFIFCYLYYQLFRIVLREPDEYRRLLAVGLGGWLVIQTIVNIAAMVALIPLTGVPLPFISYGGSSLITQLSSIGILLRISLTQR